MSGNILSPEVFINLGGRPGCVGRVVPNAIGRTSIGCGGRLGIGCKLCAAYRKKVEEDCEARLKAHLSKLAAMSDEEKKKLQEEQAKRMEEMRLRADAKHAARLEKIEARKRMSALRRKKIEHLVGQGLLQERRLHRKALRTKKIFTMDLNSIDKAALIG